MVNPTLKLSAAEGTMETRQEGFRCAEVAESASPSGVEIDVPVY
jgi:hypothetical protein